MLSLGGDNALFAYAHPPVTSVDVDLEGHLRQAMAFLEAIEHGTLGPDDRLRLIEPRLLVRQSVASVNALSV
jgi:DNA-binding LacI/PurR family transcriptional regulator